MVNNYFFVLLLLLSSQTLAQQITIPGFHSSLLHNNLISVRISNMGDTDEYLYNEGGAGWDLIPYEYNLIVYDHGPWIIGKINNQVRAGFVKWGSSFSPGPIINGHAAIDTAVHDLMLYRTYKLSKIDSAGSRDIRDWPVQWGAPVDEKGNPVVYADEMVWAVYNGLYKNGFFRDWNPAPSIPVEVIQKVYSYNNLNPRNILASTIFYEYTLINKSPDRIDSAYFGFWSDIDFGNLSCNFPAVDVKNQLAYCWTTNKCSPKAPISVGYVLLNGPAVPQQNSAAFFQGRIIANHKNLNLSSFHAVLYDGNPSPVWGDFYDMQSAWNAARGLGLDGKDLIDSATGQITKFPFSGDPVTNSGYIFNGRTSGGAGFLMYSGPFTMAPMDTQWAVLALIAAKDSSSLGSITKLRRHASVLRSIPYNNLVIKNSVKIIDVSPLPEYFTLYQNYPNPFNSTTKIRFIIPDVGGKAKLPVKLKLMNVLGEEVAVLAEKEYEPGEHTIEFNSDRFNLSSGVYFYSIEAREYFKVRKMMVLK